MHLLVGKIKVKKHKFWNGYRSRKTIKLIHPCHDHTMKKAIRSFIYSPKFNRMMVYLAMAVFFSGIILAMIIAFIYGGSRKGPGYFSIMNNYISDLGSHHYTLAPFIFDLTMMITSVLLVPVMHIMHKQVLENWEAAKQELGVARARSVKITISVGLSGLIVGLVGFFGVGVFSEDRSTIGVFHNLHLVVSILVWGGLAFASLFYGIAALRMKTIIPRVLSFFMIVGPVASVALFTLAAFVIPEFLPSKPLEWIMLACAFWWMVPVGVILLRIIKKTENKT